jgi:hypothetical protein
MAALNCFEAAGSKLMAAMSMANLTEAAKSKSTKAGLGEVVAPDLVKAARADFDFLDFEADLDFLDFEAELDFLDLEANLAKVVEAVWVAMVER